jgi:hypothetical protein
MRGGVLAALACAAAMMGSGQAAAGEVLVDSIGTVWNPPWSPDANFVTAGGVTTMTISDLPVSNVLQNSTATYVTPAYLTVSATFPSFSSGARWSSWGVEELSAGSSLLSFNLHISSQLDHSTILDVNGASGNAGFYGLIFYSPFGSDLSTWAYFDLNNVDFYSPFGGAPPQDTTAVFRLFHLDQFFTPSGPPLIPNTGSFGDFVLNAVPEPSTWAMMLLGFFGLGAALRRRRQAALV